MAPVVTPLGLSLKTWKSEMFPPSPAGDNDDDNDDDDVPIIISFTPIGLEEICNFQTVISWVFSPY